MFIRWKRYQRYRWRRDSTTRQRKRVLIDERTRSAAVLKSVRTPAGPRQEYVTYLGTIAEGQERDKYPRWRFWSSAEENLREARVAGDDLAHVVAKLGAVVPLPDGFQPGWDDRWQWLPTRMEIDCSAQVDAILAVEDELAGDAERHDYVGEIEEAQRGDEWYRECFWWYATAELDEAGLAGDERARIEVTLQAVVPRPDPAALDQAWAARRRREAEWRRLAVESQTGPVDASSPVVPASDDDDAGIRFEAKMDASCAVSDERGGVPRIDYLAGISEAKRGDERYRRWFWQYATAELAKAPIGADDRARIEAALAAVVPRPGDHDRPPTSPG